MTEISFSGRAYAKLLLHAVKYPHCAINGLLLGKQVASELQVVDAVPLFHICLHVSPMAEVALTLVEQVAASQGLMIVGYYLANENINDTSIDKPAHRGISEKIAENFSNAIVAVIDNKDMTLGMLNNPLRISQYSEGKWKTKEKSSVSYEKEDTLFQAMYVLIKMEDYRNLVDFDNHLDDISLDWQNKEMNKLVERTLTNTAKK
ncbi:hypothetical protein QAD02_006153 [Eretmocerus hayati]|uniref:Uncharacterized protein n=1 Tax=Eretmocerus hayati TaxID=131215 RepID=A0ACC2N0I4_9HYME|nr:hypothetical protein QAD02_006153 [Eretmocerus hayati]